MSQNRFEALLKAVPDSAWKDALVEVLDTAFMCHVWFEAHDIIATSGDIVRMTELVCARESEKRREAQQDIPL